MSDEKRDPVEAMAWAIYCSLVEDDAVLEFDLSKGYVCIDGGFNTEPVARAAWKAAFSFLTRRAEEAGNEDAQRFLEGARRDIVGDD